MPAEHYSEAFDRLARTVEEASARIVRALDRLADAGARERVGSPWAVAPPPERRGRRVVWSRLATAERVLWDGSQAFVLERLTATDGTGVWAHVVGFLNPEPVGDLAEASDVAEAYMAAREASHEEPDDAEPREHDPGPEVDDQGGMSEAPRLGGFGDEHGHVL